MTLAFLIASCGQNDSKQKELELKEKELTAKQKELEQREAELQTKKDSSKITLPANEETKAEPELTITPLKASADLGQVTFTQNEKTVFFFVSKSHNGKIILNDNEYLLTKQSLNNNNVYTLSGSGVIITTSPCKWNNEDGGDCSYGRFSSVKIKLGTAMTDLKNVKVQDCPDME